MNNVQRRFLFLAFITPPGNLDSGFHVGHKWPEAELSVMLEHKPDTKEMELTELCFQYIVAVEAKIILYPVMHYGLVTVIMNLQ